MKTPVILALVLLCSLAVFTACEDKPAADAAAPETTKTAQPTVDNAADPTKIGSTTDAEAVKREEEQMNYDGFSTAELKAMKSEKFEFQAEVGRLMDIIINSLYSNREIFIREVISNGSDALDKIRFESLTNKDALGDHPDLDMRIKIDKDRRTISLRDSGIGMTPAELKQNLGTVASSGTTRFVEAAKQGKDALSLIGQFGVGFYSVYLVADKVTVVSKHPNATQHVWVSDANQTFTIAEDPRGNTLGRGTEVILHLKEDAQEFLDMANVEKIVTKYSSFINFPIYLWKSKMVDKEVPLTEEEIKKQEEEKKPEDKPDDKKDEDKKDEDKKEEEKPKTKTIQEEVWDWEQVNANKAIWTRSPRDVTDKEYDEFYKTLTKDYTEPLTKVHFAAEGEISFRSILFVPKTAPSDLYDKYYGKSQALKLYVRRVLISDEFEDFMPRYLSFIKGVVDSDDLPLNVSRETLSKSRVLKVMGKKLTRKALEMLRKLMQGAEDAMEEEAEAKKAGVPDDETDEQKKEREETEKARKKKIDDWFTFWKNFGKSIKLGLIEDTSNKSKLQKLVRFTTSKSKPGRPVSLQSYVNRMKDEQKHIYYITGETLDAVKNSPFLEKLNKKGYEVIYMVDPLDEYLMSNMPEFDGKKFMSATKEGLKFGDESDVEKNREKKLKKHYEGLTSYLKETLGEKVEKVVVSNRITDSPCILVTSQYGWSANMERIMKAQTFADVERQKYMVSKKTMEINPKHPIIRQMRQKVADGDVDDKMKDMAALMYDSALLSSGFAMQDVNAFASRIQRILGSGLGVSDQKPITDDELDAELPAEEEEKPKEDEKDDESVDLDEDKKDDAAPKDEL